MLTCAIPTTSRIEGHPGSLLCLGKLYAEPAAREGSHSRRRESRGDGNGGSNRDVGGGRDLVKALENFVLAAEQHKVGEAMYRVGRVRLFPVLLFLLWGEGVRLSCANGASVPLCVFAYVSEYVCFLKLFSHMLSAHVVCICMLACMLACMALIY